MSRLTVLTSLLTGFAVLSATIGPVRASVLTTGMSIQVGPAHKAIPGRLGAIGYLGKTGSGTLHVEAAGVVANMGNLRS